MATLAVNGTSLEYIDQGRGEPVVLIHGSASDYRSWRQQMGDFGRDFRTIAYSRRYHWPNHPIPDGSDYSMREHVEDLTALLDALDANPAHLVGHSYGALMALALASEEPQYVRSLVLAEPPAISLYVENSNAPRPSELLKLLFSRPRTGLAVVKLGVTGLAPAANAAKRGDMNEVMRLFGRAALGRQTFERMSEERKEQVRVNLSKAEFLGSGFLPLGAQKLRSIDIPTLLLTAELSPRVFRHLARRLHELIPNAEQREVSSASHIMQEDNAAEFNATLLSFLDRHRLQA